MSRPWHDATVLFLLRDIPPPRPFRSHNQLLPHLALISQQLDGLSQRADVAKQRFEKLSEESRAAELALQNRPWWKRLSGTEPSQDSNKKESQPVITSIRLPTGFPYGCLPYTRIGPVIGSHQWTLVNTENCKIS